MPINNSQFPEQEQVSHLDVYVASKKKHYMPKSSLLPTCVQVTEFCQMRWEKKWHAHHLLCAIKGHQHILLSLFSLACWLECRWSREKPCIVDRDKSLEMLKRHSRRSDNRGPGSRRIYRSQLPQKLTPLGKRKLIFSCVNPCYFGFFVPRYRNYILTNILLKCVTGTAHHDWSESMIGRVNGVTGLLFFLHILSLMLTTGLLFFSF